MSIIGAGGSVRAKASDPGSDHRKNGGKVVMIQTFPQRGANREGYQELHAELRTQRGTLIGAAKASQLSAYNGVY
jgi:hypothetical protein